MAAAPDRNAPKPDDGAPDYCDLDPFTVSAAGHDFTFYPHGQDRLKALVEEIDSARESLRVFYYLFDSDTSGTMVRDALIRAVRRGVSVDLIVDAFGNDAGAAFFEPLVEAGGHFAVFSPKWGTRYLVRNHQKFTIVDNARVMTGGANISDHYFAIPAENGWCDLSVLVEGPVVEQFTRWFGLLKNWVASAADGRTRQLRRLRGIVQDWQGGDGPVRLLVGGPLVRKGHWAWVFRKDLVAARRLDAVSAYFSPPRSFRRLIARVGRRGEARFIMAGKSDISAAISMARMLYGQLLRARVKIYEFAICKLHMKLLVVDDKSYFGSANLDKRSFRINVELMVRVEDAGLAAKLREMIDHLEESSDPITPAWYAKNSTPLTRLRWRIAYWMSLADYRISKVGTR
ncbi:phospholipase D-like domain-containing protein [Erythrobacter sp. WG]|uniref:phospholipase D-like domain-containing protein n=1 Tax=Erythrobacter sp. WG TaxID=2985510 RepID=UPI00226F89B5|nr:phosphatidylserine/phosphatidylglycerophosphate/cardiolipin synthase family protein [Erythrobacter sp. WG]MCX9146975.1 phosphatidylserine/phosphatidylglycerophosphate/cardiolipin synthase family protein [Erythrobacter sp. WG]